MIFQMTIYVITFRTINTKWPTQVMHFRLHAPRCSRRIFSFGCNLQVVHTYIHVHTCELPWALYTSRPWILFCLLRLKSGYDQYGFNQGLKMIKLGWSQNHFGILIVKYLIKDVKFIFLLNVVVRTLHIMWLMM